MLKDRVRTIGTILFSIICTVITATVLTILGFVAMVIIEFLKN